MKRHFDTSSHRGKAQLSLLVNFASRAPSIIGILFFVPLIYRELGDLAYGQLMAAISLGGLASVLLGGGFYLGRRRIGEAMFDERHHAEAYAFMTLMRASLAAGLIGIAVAIAYGIFQSWAAVFIIIAVLQIGAGLAAALDEARTAYNELYVTAAARTVFQTAGYVIGLTVAWVARSPLLAAFVMILPAIVASLFSTGLLLAKRPYLISSEGKSYWPALREGLPIGLIDGLVMMAVNLSVVLVQAALPPEGGAWYATIVRLFVLILALAMLLVTPMTSYVRGIWNQRPTAMQSRISFYWMAISIAFGVGTLATLWLADIVYLGMIMGIDAPFPPIETIAILAGLGAVGTFKCFTAFGYILMNTRAINISFGTVLLVSVIAAFVGRWLFGPEGAVLWSALAFAACLVSAICWLHFSGKFEVEAE